MASDPQRRFSFPEIEHDGNDVISEQQAQILAADLQRLNEEIRKKWEQIHDRVLAIAGVSGCSFPAPWGPSGSITITMDPATQPNDLEEIQREVEAVCGTLMSYMKFQYSGPLLGVEDDDVVSLQFRAA